MANPGRPVIVRSNAGYWHLARECEHGIQTDIENFISLGDAMTWATANQPTARFVVFGTVRLTLDGVRNLHRVMNGHALASSKGLRACEKAGLAWNAAKPHQWIISDAGIALFAPAGQGQEIAA